MTTADGGVRPEPGKATVPGKPQRAEALGGTLLLSSSDGQGTVVEVVLPRR